MLPKHAHLDDNLLEKNWTNRFIDSYTCR